MGKSFAIAGKNILIGINPLCNEAQRICLKVQNSRCAVFLVCLQLVNYDSKVGNNENIIYRNFLL